MQADKTTLQDLSIIHKIEAHSVLHILDFTTTSVGKEQLNKLLLHPLPSIAQIQERQHLLQSAESFQDHWPDKINNGTISVIQKFFKTPIAGIPYKGGALEAWMFKFFHKNDFGVAKFTAEHLHHFALGLLQLSEILQKNNLPESLQIICQRINVFLSKQASQQILHYSNTEDLSVTELLNVAYWGQVHKSDLQQMIQIFGEIDAYRSLAIAKQRLGFTYPSFVENSETPILEVAGLWHPLVKNPVANEINLDATSNFCFLTGANMGGKSTFIKSVGIATYLAHVGIAVPANQMKLTYFEGILSNIQVVDNVLEGESYFYNEVQRIRQTVDKVKNGQHWLILIDELFKGTNMQDAIRCSLAVVRGLAQVKTSVFVLSTHLYEIGNDLHSIANIQFRYFQTFIDNHQLQFTYKLTEGISNDRIGYLILEKEGVVETLNALGNSH